VIGSFGLKSETNIRTAARTGFTRPVDIPDAFIGHVLGMTHRAFVGAMRASLVHLGQRSLADRLTALGLAGKGYCSCRRND
jgi:hypothetical protein